MRYDDPKMDFLLLLRNEEPKISWGGGVPMIRLATEMGTGKRKRKKQIFGFQSGNNE